MSAKVQNLANSATPATDLKDPIYLRLRDLVYQTCGIYHPEEKLYLLARACSRRIAAAEVQTARNYVDLLGTPQGRAAELRELLNEITIGETSLFRSRPQLDALRNVIVPELCAVRGKTGIKKLRIWSAGCSTGEEPYTLATVLLEEREKVLQGWGFEITATDLNDRSLETAKAGIYGSYALRNTPEYFRRKYFCAEAEGKLRVSDNVKQCVAFSRVNLSDDSKMVFMKGMDLIFCCNVLIYFDLQSKKRVIQHFYANLLTHGYFFLGNSETLYQVSESFRVIHLPGTVGYWKAPPEGAESKKI